jgi:hypothetical protein
MNTKPGASKRWALWLPLLAAGVWLALFGDKSPAGDAAVSLPVKPLAKPSMPQPTATGQVERARASHSESAFALVPRAQLFGKIDGAAGAGKPTARDLFSTRNWNPPPPLAPPEQPGPLPVAPTLPYTFLGKKLEGGTWEVFLAKGEQTFVARTNQVLENDWRVDRISPPSLTLTYLPLGLPQTLSIGDSR